MKQFLKSLFCLHKYNEIEEISYVITNKDKRIVGTVKLLHKICSKCNKVDITSHDRRDEQGKLIY